MVWKKRLEFANIMYETIDTVATSFFAMRQTSGWMTMWVVKIIRLRVARSQIWRCQASQSQEVAFNAILFVRTVNYERYLNFLTENAISNAYYEHWVQDTVFLLDRGPLHSTKEVADLLRSRYDIRFTSQMASRIALAMVIFVPHIDLTYYH